jgi:hypothetical protein
MEAFLRARLRRGRAFRRWCRTLKKVKYFIEKAREGKVKLVVRDARTGEVLNVIEQTNLIVNVGHILVAQIMNDESVTKPNYIAVGSGTTDPNVNDTTLEGEIGRIAVLSRTRTNNQVLYSTYFGSGDCNGTWNKIGLFNAESGGTLFSELKLASSFSKDTTKAVDCEYTITF